MTAVGLELGSRPPLAAAARGADRLGVQACVLVGLGTLYSIAFSFTQWQERPTEGWLASSATALPISPIAWFTVVWLVFAALLTWLLTAPPARACPGDERLVQQAAVVGLGAAYAAEFGARLLVVSRGDGWLAPTVGIAVALGAAAVGLGLLRRPPGTRVLLVAVLAGGTLARLARIGTAPLDPDHADNLVSISLSLDRLLAGLTPYATYDFSPTHQVAMPYLPWTLLSYLPPFVLGLDIRVTNVVLSLTLALVLIWAIRRLVPNQSVAAVLGLAVGLLYALPRSIGNDVWAEFQAFNLLLVLAFVWLALGDARSAAAAGGVLAAYRRAAVAYGLSLGAMPLAIFCAPPLLCFAVRTWSGRRVLALGATAALVAALPVLAFAAWDAKAFGALVLGQPARDWEDLAAWRSASVSYSLVWHAVVRDGLSRVQPLLLLLSGVLAWLRLRTVAGVIGLSAVTYLILVLSGPHIMPHMPAVVLYLGVLAVAARACPATAEGRP